MFQELYQKVILGMILLTIIIYILYAVYYNDERQITLLCSEVDYTMKQQQLNILQHEQHQFLSPAAINILKTYQHLINLADSSTKFYEYVNSLSSIQVNDIVRLMGVSNLNSKSALEEFMQCAGIELFKQLKGKKLNCQYLNSSLPIPKSYRHCKSISFQSSGPIVTLASVPGSGNSWVRQLLESATGIYTGAVYCDLAYVKAGMMGEGMDTNNVIVVKAHYKPSYVKKLVNNDKAIYIVRSPFGAILAEHNRNITAHSKKYASLGNSHIQEVNYNYVNNSVWEAYVKKESSEWKAHVMEWLNYKEIPVLIVGYENLQKDTYTELKRMLDFIGHPYSEDDVLCTVKNSGETFHRLHTKDIHPYSPELQAFVLNEIKQVDASLLKHNISIYHPY